MNHRYLVTGLLFSLMVILSGCGSSATNQNIQVGSFATQLPSTYTMIAPVSGTDMVYYLDTQSEKSMIQFSQSQVESGITIDQMASLNLQKLEVALPGYSFIEQGARRIDCAGRHDGWIVSFITDEGDGKLFHSQFYTIISGQGYVWSVTSSLDHTRKVLSDLVKGANCG